MRRINLLILLIFGLIVVNSFISTDIKASVYTNTYPYGEEPAPKNTLPCQLDDFGFCKWNCTSYAAWKVREQFLSDFINGYMHNSIYTIYGDAQHWNDSAHGPPPLAPPQCAFRLRHGPAPRR